MALHSGSVGVASARPALLQALCAYAMWGFLPLYFRLISGVGPVEVIAHRIVWSLLLLSAVLLVQRRLRQLWAALTTWASVVPLAGSALFIGLNWLIYLWAIYNDHVVAASLGYFLNPLINVVLAYFVLKERLSRTQWLAIALAGTGVAILAVQALTTLWISLGLGFSFALYGLIKRSAPTGPMVGLASETAILLPAAAGYLAWQTAFGAIGFGAAPANDALLIGGGAVTALPLLLFAAAARKLPFATIGVLQFLAPTIQFLLGIFLFREPLTSAHLISFPLIWAGLAMYSWDMWRASRAQA